MILSKEGLSWICQLLAANILGFSSLTSQTAFPASALWSSLVSGCLGLHPTHLSCQVTFVPQAPNWQLPLLPLGSSSSGSEGKPYHSLPWWQHFCCHCTSQCRHSISSNLGATTLPQHVQGLSHHIQPQSHHIQVHSGECSLHPHAYMILDEKASILSLSLVATASSYSVGSSTLVATLSSSTVAVACCTTRR